MDHVRHPERSRGIRSEIFEVTSSGSLGPSRTGIFAREDRYFCSLGISPKLFNINRWLKPLLRRPFVAK